MHPLLSGDGILPSPHLREQKSIRTIRTIESQPVKMVDYTHVQSYSFQRSIHSNGSGQMTFAQGLFEGQFLSKFLAIVA